MIKRVELGITFNPAGDWTQKYFNSDLNRGMKNLDRALNEGFVIVTQQPFKALSGEFMLYILHKPDEIETPSE